MTSVPSVIGRSAGLRVGRAGRTVVGTVVLIVVGVPLVTAYDLWLFVVNGVADGAIYSLAAIGLVLTYKTSGILNFAIGAQAALSAYLFYSFRISLGLPWPLAALIALILAGLVASVLLERLGTWLAEAPAVMKVVASIGLLVLIQSALTGAYGQTTLQFPQFLPDWSFPLAGLSVQFAQVVAVVVALAATGGLYVFFKRTRVGVAMQAVVDDSNLLALQASDPASIRRYAWAIGSCFVSISGMLIAPAIGVDVNYMLLLYITAFGAAALGGFTSIPITFVSAIAIGVGMNVMSDRLAGQQSLLLAGLYTQVPFLVLVLALLFVPRTRFSERGATRARKLPPVPQFPRPVLVASLAAAAVLVLLLPHIAGSGYVTIYTTGVGFAVILASLGLIIWTSGQISLCHVAFAAVGASTLAHAQNMGLPWLIALLLAGLVTVPVGALVAIPSFRLTGVHLAVATFAFGLLFQNLLYRTSLMFGQVGSRPVERPVLGGLGTDTNTGYFYVCALVAAACFALIILVKRSRLGQLLRALSDSPAALDAHGANTRVTQLLVFSLSAFIAGIGGALIAGVTQYASSDLAGPFGYFNSLTLVAILAVCGRRTILSPVLAAFSFQVLKVYPPFDTAFFRSYQGVFFGVGAIAVAVAPALRVQWDRRARERMGGSPARQRLLPAPQAPAKAIP